MSRPRSRIHGDAPIHPPEPVQPVPVFGLGAMARLKRLEGQLDNIRTEAIRLRTENPTPRNKWIAARITRARNEMRRIIAHLEAAK